MRVDYGYVFRISLNHAISRRKSRFHFEIKVNPYELLDVIEMLFFNPHTPIAQKIADEVVFRCFQGEGVEFF